VAFFLAACGAPKPGDQDVSFLVPLDQARAFLPASEVLPRAVFDRLQHPLTVVDEPDALYAATATVAVRLDRCFREGTDANVPCRPQVRLVLQPVFDSADGVTTRDAAVHAFFSVTEAEALAAVKALAELRARYSVVLDEGLTGAHPGFARAAWVEGVKKTLQPLLTPSRVVRMTAMSVHASNQAWIFSGLEVQGGQVSDLEIPTQPGHTDDHVTSTGATDGITMTLDPGPVAEPALPTVLQTQARRSASAADLAAGLSALARIEDPTQHNPGTIDCASCHAVASARWFAAREGLTVEGGVAPSDTYGDSRALRALGYFFTAPAISPRVQRETRAVRADFEAHLEP